jgi:threonine dehydrogenase-like Zn-dependent dehydrogenase
LFFTIYLSPVEYPSAVELIARKLVDVRGLITHRFKLSEIEKALKTLDDPSEKPLKTIIIQ